ncbi:hypothetical protein MKW94_008245 [Papaver nudicaule]|uniref:BED-type domain-containing protein n=1 Tax=Papaver nudicaule TaxID=74823 RepID=A0AA42AU10_PAPNU|nr:hypothetical protein [Papaver nudicaule]
MEGTKVPKLHDNPRIPWQAQVREPMYGVNVNESERQSRAEKDAQEKEQRRILYKAKQSLMTEQEKEAVREKRRNTYLRRKVGSGGDENKVVDEAETCTGRPHQRATTKAYNIPSIVLAGGSEVSSLPQSPIISEQAQHRVHENKTTGMSTDMEPKNTTGTVKVIERASLYLMFFQTAPDEKSRRCKLCDQSYPIKTAYGNLGRHLNYRHPGYDKMGDDISSPSLTTAAVSERADNMSDAIPSLLPQPITSVTESADKKGDAVPSLSPQLITIESKTADTTGDAIIASPLLPSVRTVSKRAQSQVKHSTVNFGQESCNNEHTTVIT